MLSYIGRLTGAFVILFATLSVARSANRTWNATSGNFGQQSNWNPTFVPGAADQATFGTNATYTVTFNNAGSLPNPTLNRDLFFSAGNVTFASSPGSPYTYQLTGAGGSDANITGGTLTLGTGSTPLNLAVDDDLIVRGGATLNIFGGSAVNTVDLVLAQTASGGGGAIVVDGTGSQLNVSGGLTQSLALNGNSATLTFRNASSGTFSGPVDVGLGAGTAGTINVQSSAHPNFASLGIGTGTSGGGTVNVTGTDSSLVQTGASTLTLGTASGGVGAINIGTSTTGGTLTTGTGLFTINKTGTVTVGSASNDGTLNANGNVTIDGGVLQTFHFSLFLLAPGKTFTVQSGGRATFALSQQYATANAIYNVTGTNSKWEPGAGGLSIQNGAQVNVTSGGTLASLGTQVVDGMLNIGVNGSDGTLTGGLEISQAGAVTIGSATSTGTFDSMVGGNVDIDGGVLQLWNPGSNFLLREDRTFTVLNGGQATFGRSFTAANNKSIITGTNSKWNFVSGAGLTIGSDAQMNISLGGLVSAEGDVTIASAGRVTIDTGGTLIANSLVISPAPDKLPFSFINGTLSITGPAGLTLSLNNLGLAFIVDATHALNVVNTTTIPAGGSFAVDGGTFNTGSLVIDGSFSFNRGTLGITGPAGLTIGVGGTFGSKLLIDDAHAFRITNNLTINNGSSLTVYYAVDKLSVGSLINNGDLLLVSSTVDGQVVNNNAITVVGSVNFNGPVSGPGGFFGPGTAHFNGGFSPGASPAIVGFEGNVALSSANVLKIEIGGTTPGVQYDRLLVDGKLSVAGTLQVSLINAPFAPTAGQSFDIFNAGEMEGVFSSLQLPQLTAPLGWDISRLYSDGALSVTATVHGDFNRDGRVTAADIPAMLHALTDLSNYTATNSLSLTQLAAIGDFNSSGTVTNGDIQGLLNLVATLGGGSAAAVPEPSAWVLALGGLIGFACMRPT